MSNNDELERLVRELNGLVQELKKLVEGLNITFSPHITVIANSGDTATIVGGNQDNDQANKAEVDQSNKQLGVGNTGNNASDTLQLNSRTGTNG